MSDVLPEPEDFGAPLASEAHTSFGGQLTAEWANTLDPKNSLSGSYIYRRIREGIAGGYTPHDWDGVGTPEQQMALQDIEQRARDAIPDTSIEDARARLKQEGLEKDVHLPADQPSIKSPVLDLMIQEAHDRRDREAAISRGPDSFFPNALGFVTSMGVGMIDPVNIAAFSIPVLGEARVARMVAAGGDSLLGRAAIKAGQGALQGGVGTAVLQPADWWLHTRDGQDYTMAEAMRSVVMGAGMGAGFHAIGGGYRDLRARMRGLPLEGSPQDLLLRGLMTGTHVHADQLDADGVPIGDVPGMEDHEVPGVAPAPHQVAAVIADLPPAAKEDVVHAAMADVINGTPVRAAEVLNIAADHDPRIAESFEAWHGSPHDFDRFDISKLGTGEGAQVYGHGLYFAENEKVARSYKATTSDKAFVNKVAELYDQYMSPGDAWAEIEGHWDEFSPGEQRLMKALQQDDWLGYDYPHQAVNAALRSLHSYDASPETAAAARAIGHMYRVKINANHEHFLDWDADLSVQHPRARAAIENLFSDHGVFRGGAITGRELYEHLAAEQLRARRAEQDGVHRSQGYLGASAALAEAGIPGIKYFDKKSRAQGEGTRNFVVFNDKHIEITHKNGEPVSIEQLRGTPEARVEAAGQPKIPDLTDTTEAPVAVRGAPEAAAIPDLGTTPPEPALDTTVTINGQTTRIRGKAAAPEKPVPPAPDRGTQLAAAAQDPRWRELADVTPDYNEPDVLEESRAADHVEEPASVAAPERALTALEQEAKRADEIWRQIEPTLTESERKLFGDALDQLKLDKDARDKIISDGVACLLGAIG
ncbi:hypothetical protein ACVWW6_006022 [Bradyrhizobium sp. USDA 3311]